jgi:hypothetical protein
MIIAILALVLLAGMVGFVLGLKQAERFLGKKLQDSWARERRMHLELERAMDAYRKVVTMYNGLADRYNDTHDDSKRADWWRDES